METAREIIEAAKAKLPDPRRWKEYRIRVPITFRDLISKREIGIERMLTELRINQDYIVEFRKEEYIEDGLIIYEWEFERMY